MSSLAVRQWFRSEVQSRLPLLPYRNTINQTPDPRNLPELWVTLEFSDATEQRLTIGKRAIFREFGQATVIVLGLSGRTDEAVLEAAEQVRASFMDATAQLTIGSETGYFRLDSPDPPNTDSTESGNWFLASVSCPYTLEVTRGTP